MYVLATPVDTYQHRSVVYYVSYKLGVQFGRHNDSNYVLVHIINNVERLWFKNH